MDRVTALKTMLVGGVAFIIVGLLMIVMLSSVDYVGIVYTGLGVAMIILGIAWTAKVKKVLDRELARSRRRSHLYHYVLLVLIIGLTLVVPVYAQTQDLQACVWAYRRVVYVEYIMLGLTIMAGFLALGPIILGRTTLGPIVQEFQWFAGAMLLILIFALLMLYPLDVMFEIDNPAHPTRCQININRLQSNGPPLLRILLRLLNLPNPPST